MDDLEAWKAWKALDNPFHVSELDALLASAEDVGTVRAKCNARLKRDRILWFAACWLLAVAVVILVATVHWR